MKAILNKVVALAVLMVFAIGPSIAQSSSCCNGGNCCNGGACCHCHHK